MTVSPPRRAFGSTSPARRASGSDEKFAQERVEQRSARLGRDQAGAVAAQEAVGLQGREARGVDRSAGEAGVAVEIRALAEAEGHHQVLGGAVLVAQGLGADRLRGAGGGEPGAGRALGLGGEAAALDGETAMRAGADAGEVAGAPVDEVVPALR